MTKAGMTIRLLVNAVGIAIILVLVLGTNWSLWVSVPIGVTGAVAAGLAIRYFTGTLPRI